MVDRQGGSDPYHWLDNDLILFLQVQPKASRDEWIGCHGEFFKVRISAAPVDGKANTHLIKFLARLFGVPKSRISLLTGSADRIKRLCVSSPSTLPTEIQRQ